MITVACVLRGGGEYEPWHVTELRDQVAEHLPMEHRFVCVTDMDVEVESRPLRHDWPGWWAKVELWHPDNFTGRVLYFDLDTAIVGDLSDLASYNGRFGMINDLGLPEGGKNRHRFGASGVMAWNANDPRLSRDIYETFARVAESAMAGRDRSGDQHWIAGSVDNTWDDLRALYPGQIQSWKFTVGRKNPLPPNTRVLCWHGSPKPWDPEVDWYNRAA